MTGPGVGEPVILLRKTLLTTRDRLGGDVFGEDPVSLIAAFDPGGSTESVSGGGDMVVSKPRVFLPAGTVLSAGDRVTVRGVTYDVDGVGADWRSPWSDWTPGVEVVLKSVTG